MSRAGERPVDLTGTGDRRRSRTCYPRSPSSHSSGTASWPRERSVRLARKACSQARERMKADSRRAAGIVQPPSDLAVARAGVEVPAPDGKDSPLAVYDCRVCPVCAGVEFPSLPDMVPQTTWVSVTAMPAGPKTDHVTSNFELLDTDDGKEFT